MPNDMTINKHATTSIPDHVIFQEIDGKSALLNMDTEQYHGLDEVGTMIWQHLEKGISLADATNALLDIFDVEQEVLEADIIELATELSEAGLIEIHGPQS